MAATNVRPKVSICVPTYNGESFLRACLQSALEQTFTDFELLVVDDCSTDSTPDIVREFASRDSRIVFLQNERNLGLVGNWNKCVAVANGEWLKFLFQDDLLHSECVATMVAKAAHPIVFCRRNFLFEQGTSLETIEKYKALPGLASVAGKDGHISAETMQAAVLSNSRNFFGEPTASLIHRTVFDRFGLFNPDLAQFCDLEYWIRVSVNTGLTYVDEALATFRYHASSTSATNRDSRNDERVSVFDQLVMAYEYAYGPHFGPLRALAAKSSPKRDLRRECSEKASWVQARARALSHDSASPDPSWLKRWNELAATYPHLNQSGWQFTRGMRSMWNRYLGWRLA